MFECFANRRDGEGIQSFNHDFNFFVRRSAPEVEADRARSCFRRDAHRLQHGR